jgi:hypothetical protein
MNKYLFILLGICALLPPINARADYALGCKDPKYNDYLLSRFADFDRTNKRLVRSTLIDYKTSLSSTNPFRPISDLSRHLRYSAQFEPVEEVQSKIELLLDHGDALRVDQQIAISAFDSFSDENHTIGIARAWIAYKKGNTETAFTELLNSIKEADSAVLSSFGPDMYFVRQIYRDGHVKPVLEYLKETEKFWKGKDPDNMRYIWRNMIEAGCGIAFESLDAVKALELGLRVRDVRRNYSLD